MNFQQQAHGQTHVAHTPNRQKPHFRFLAGFAPVTPPKDIKMHARQFAAFTFA
jgi:hypothetical protein